VSLQEKAELRRRSGKIREGMPPEIVREKSKAVCDHLSNWRPFQQATTVLTFLAFGNEIDLNSLIERWPEKQWLVPRVVEGSDLSPGQKPYLMIHPYDPTRLVRHRFGMLEPDSSMPSIDPTDVDLVLVPGVAFDRRGGRIGYGGGFYDRLLPLANQSTHVGVTFEELMFASIPMEPWDCRVEWIVTPAGLIKTQD
jgi:5-formyltetrahydrofolate cyclo-ligase